MSRIVKGCIVALFCICLVLSVNIVYGSQLYQFEATSDYLSRDEDTLEITGYGLSATYYFKNVETGNHPLAEAPFMEKASSISVPAGLTNIEDNSGMEADGPILGAELTYIHPTHSIYTSASFSTMEAEIDNSPSNAEIAMDEYTLGIGMYLQEGMLVSFEYGHEEFDNSVFVTENDIYTVSGKWLRKNGSDTALNLEANIGVDNYDAVTTDGSNTIIGAACDYYFNPKLSVGGGLSLNTGDDVDAEGNTYEIRSSYFFNPRFSVKAGYETFAADNDGSDDIDVISFNLSTRF